jgi:Fur family transcriptional regulator, ferric uptake regulator
MAVMGDRSRTTRQGGVVREALASADGFRSAQSVYADLRAGGETIGLSTVYRHLQSLAAAGSADTLQTGDGQLLYRLCGGTARHHHHLVCRNCGATVEVEGRAIENWTDRVAAAHGFTDVAHTVELIGLCAACSAST